MIKLRGLKVSLGGRMILTGVDLEVRAGETVAVVGVSGSGKSTLLRAAAGLVRPDEGEVELAGTVLKGSTATARRAVRQEVGMLFQANALFDSMTVTENIGFVLREVLDEPEEKVGPRVSELLMRLRLGPIGDNYPAQLSGGMKKRVGIARAVAHGPKIVFYDDPTAGLDPITSNVIADLIAELGREPGRAAVVVSNQLPVVNKVAQRVMLLREGMLIELGPPSEAFANGRAEMKEFLGASA